MQEKDIIASKPAPFISPSFNGGMVRLIDPTDLEANQYNLLINGRTRFGKVVSIKEPYNFTANTDSPAGLHQGVYGVDNKLIVFINGYSFVKDYGFVGSPFSLVTGWLQMNPTAETIWAELVPSSFTDLKRTQRTAGDERSIKLENLSGSSPASLVCQDGTNQPRLILENGSSRLANDILQWSRNDDPYIDNREYVPIGTRMMYHPDGKLYIINGREIYHSVSGRPLDFVVAVNTTGDRLFPEPSGGEASRLSFKVSYQGLTAIYPLPTKIYSDTLASGFFVSSEKDTWMVLPNYNDLIYGEPKFRNIHLFDTGSLNQFSISNLLNDTVFIDFTGVKSFSAIDRFSESGENSPFSRNVHDLFEGVEQTTTASFKFNNYALFGVNTKYGPGVLVYDELLQTFVGIDIFNNVTGRIKQFASIIFEGIRKLFFITESGLYEYEAGTTTATCKLYTKEWYFSRSEVEQKPFKVNLIFRNIKSSGVVTVREYVDGVGGTTRSKTITFSDADGSVSVTPENVPFNENENNEKGNITFKLLDARRGLVAGLFITFTFDAELKQVELISEEKVVHVGHKQASKSYE